VEEAGTTTAMAEGDCMASPRKKVCVRLKQQTFDGPVANLVTELRSVGPRTRKHARPFGRGRRGWVMLVETCEQPTPAQRHSKFPLLQQLK
jgi:hypothetical protein